MPYGCVLSGCNDSSKVVKSGSDDKSRSEGRGLSVAIDCQFCAKEAVASHVRQKASR